MNTRILPAALLAALTLSGCVGLVPYVESPNTVIATARDTGIDSKGLIDGEAAIAYDPDGCQNWLIDDGLEGYSTPRYDPVSGLPVCNNQFPPGAVVGNYQTSNAPLRDWVPAPARRN
jgi:hypothetical protein